MTRRMYPEDTLTGRLKLFLEHATETLSGLQACISFAEACDLLWPSAHRGLLTRDDRPTIPLTSFMPKCAPKHPLLGLRSGNLRYLCCHDVRTASSHRLHQYESAT